MRPDAICNCCTTVSRKRPAVLSCLVLSRTRTIPFGKRICCFWARRRRGRGGYLRHLLLRRQAGGGDSHGVQPRLLQLLLAAALPDPDQRGQIQAAVLHGGRLRRHLRGEPGESFPLTELARSLDIISTTSILCVHGSEGKVAPRRHLIACARCVR